MNEKLITIIYIRRKHSYDQQMSKQVIYIFKISVFEFSKYQSLNNFLKSSIHGIKNTSTLYVNLQTKVKICTCIFLKVNYK